LVLYAIYRYAWGERTTGFSLMVVGICTGAISALVTGRMVKRFGEKATLLLVSFSVRSECSARASLATAWNFRFDSDYLALEYFHAGRAKYDDASRQRAGTR